MPKEQYVPTPENLEQVLSKLSDVPCRMTDIVDAVGRAKANVSADVRALELQGRVVRTGKTKSTRYALAA